MKNRQLILGLLVGVAVGLLMFRVSGSFLMGWTAGISAWVAYWWITEPVPIPVTSLIPLTLFPLSGVLTATQVAEAYGNQLILLMLGGFMLSSAMEKSGVHRRIALGMVNLFGVSNGKTLVLGFMAAAALLSMWISNAATTLMLLPIVMAVVNQTENRRLQIALLLAIAYGASIGGIATPIGTPPNVIFMGVYLKEFQAEISFLQWIGWMLPIMVVMAVVSSLWLTRGVGKIASIDLPEMGRWRTVEVRTLIVFGITAFFWVTRKAPFGGWSALGTYLGGPDPFGNSATVGLLGTLAMFLVPSGEGDERILDWGTARKIPWGILLLFAAGLTMASAFKESGLSQLLGEKIASFGPQSTLLLILLVCLAVTFLTEITSNTATTTLLLPVLATAAKAGEIDPKLLMIPATISASFAFMLPVATPPNAIVFGSNKLTIKEMAYEGFVLNLVGVVVVALVLWTVLGIN